MYKGEIYVANKEDAAKIMEALDSTNEFGPVRYNSKEKKIEFGFNEDWYLWECNRKKVDPNWKLYVKKFKSFEINN